MGDVKLVQEEKEDEEKNQKIQKMPSTMDMSAEYFSIMGSLGGFNHDDTPEPEKEDNVKEKDESLLDVEVTDTDKDISEVTEVTILPSKTESAKDGQSKRPSLTSIPDTMKEDDEQTSSKSKKKKKDKDKKDKDKKDKDKKDKEDEDKGKEKNKAKEKKKDKDKEKSKDKKDKEKDIDKESKSKDKKKDKEKDKTKEKEK